MMVEARGAPRTGSQPRPPSQHVSQMARHREQSRLPHCTISRPPQTGHAGCGGSHSGSSASDPVPVVAASTSEGPDLIRASRFMDVQTSSKNLIEKWWADPEGRQATGQLGAEVLGRPATTIISSLGGGLLVMT